MLNAVFATQFDGMSSIYSAGPSLQKLMHQWFTLTATCVGYLKMPLLQYRIGHTFQTIIVSTFLQECLLSDMSAFWGGSLILIHLRGMRTLAHSQ